MYRVKVNSWLLLSVLLTILFFSCRSSRVVGLEEGWEILGSRKVNFVRDKDVIEVKNQILYTAIRFRVEDHDIRLNSVKIYFNNGDKLEPNIDEVIAAGQNSRIIELGEDGRYISQIEFKYRTTGNLLKGRANVLVTGKKRYSQY